MICLGIFGIYAALASKMHRVNKVFNQSNRFQRVQVRVIGPSLMFLALDLILLITWTASSPLEFEYTENSSARFSPDTLHWNTRLCWLC